MNALYYPIKGSPVLTGDQEKLAAAMLDALKSGRLVPDEHGFIRGEYLAERMRIQSRCAPRYPVLMGSPLRDDFFMTVISVIGEEA